MPLSNAEKQRRYRERALKDPDGLLLTRLQVLLSPSADATLTRICERTGKTKREIVEAAILALDGYTVTATEPAKQDTIAVPDPEQPKVRPEPAKIEPDESRLYEADSSVSAWVLAHQAKHAIRQISRKDPNALAAIESIRIVMETQLQAVNKGKK